MTKPQSWSVSSGARVVFGAGSIASAGRLVAELGGSVFVCTDPVIDSAGLLSPLLASLAREGLRYRVFDGGEPEVSRATVETAVQVAKSDRPAVVLGLGGGSNLDLAKGVSMLLANDGDLSDYYGESQVPHRGVPVVAVPTTAGTGSEVTPVAVFGDPARRMKVGISSRHLVPQLAIVDPELSLSCPAGVTAHSGLDALSHGVEALCALDYAQLGADGDLERIFCGRSPYSDSLALQAIELVGTALEPAWRDGSDLGARTDMMSASLLAGLAFATCGTGLVHALQYPVGALTRTPHGLGNAVLMPAVMRFNRPVRERSLAQIARRLPGVDPALSEPDAASAAPGAVAALARSVGVPAGLASLGVQRSDIPGLAADALTVTRLIQLNPRPVDAAALESILHDAYDAET